MIKGIPENWVNVLESKLSPLTSADRALIENVAQNIAARWAMLTENSENPDAAFKTLYAQHKERAQAWIVAIVEMVRAIGDGEPERFQE